MQDNPLISAFTRLRSDLKDCKDIPLINTRGSIAAQNGRDRGVSPAGMFAHGRSDGHSSVSAILGGNGASRVYERDNSAPSSPGPRRTGPPKMAETEE
jgi:hypothetical protein